MTNSKRLVLVIIGVVFLIIVIGGLVTMGPRVWGVIKRLVTYASMPVYAEPIEANGDYANVLFLHHSTGRSLIDEGDVRPMLSELGYQFWDHDHNHVGLIRPDGTFTGAHYRIPGMRGRGNTDVDGLADLFSQPITDPPSNAFSRLMQHEVIITKSCFPNSAIKDDEMQAQFKSWYLGMRDVMDQHPDRVFIIVTSPPLHPEMTNAEEARRARAIADWLKSDEYLAGHPNVFVFDFFDLLADPATNTLRAEYQRDGDKPDSHPNLLANQTIGPQFVAFVDQAVQTYKDRGGIQ